MKVDMVMPQMGESIAEATISKWLKKPGDQVKKDEIILEISTDKVDSEIPAPASGILSEILHAEGEVVPVKSRIALIDTAADTQSRPAAAQPAPEPSRLAANIESAPPSVEPGTGESETAESRFYSPVVKSMAEKHGVSLGELGSIKGSGQGGRVNKQDFLTYLETRSAESQRSERPVAAEPTPVPPRPPSSAAVISAPEATGWGEDGTRVVLMDNMRQAIAEHMVRSKHTSPHVYSVQEVDVSAISRWRKAQKSAFEKSEGFGLSFTPFFLEAAVKALVKFPYVNSSVDGKRIVLKKHVNLGCAVALENGGLIVPVIKRAEEKSLVGLARDLNDLAGRARRRKLLPDDVMGGTFTVTNPGVFGTIIGNPIINQPQVAILCLGAIKKRVVVVDDMIAIREMCYLTLSYDHRIIDGSLGGQFLAFVREYLENWDPKRSLN